MTEPLRITLVTRDSGLAAMLAPIVALEQDVELYVETKELETLSWLANATPHVIIVVDADGRGGSLETVARLRALPRFANTRFALLRPPLGRDDGVVELNHGVQDFLTLPIVPAEFTSRLRGFADHHRMFETLQIERSRVDHLHTAFRTGFDQIIQLLIRLMDLQFPGAEARGASVAALSLRLAARFQIPERYLHDLDLAARLHEVGRMVVAAGEDDDADSPGAQPSPEHPGVAALASHALLQDVDGLDGVSDVIGSVNENWDGTGVPDRSRQGQIPLRSRILRVAIDYLAAIEQRPAAIEAALEYMETHIGTRYDPIVVAQLRATLSEDEGPLLASANLHVGIEKLAVGMVLAEDLYTDSGLKLLSRGAEISPAALETIRRRHRMEPILRGAVVEREAA